MAVKDLNNRPPAILIFTRTGPITRSSVPTYEYACTSCGRSFEVVQSFTDTPLEVCEVCAGRLRRVFHPVGVLFKGSGFYSTDSRHRSSKSDGKPKSSESDNSSAEGGKSESKTEGSAQPKKDTPGEGKSEAKPKAKSTGK
jgi:putative FmdB family regulatory protein